ncbi:MAG: ATP-dependent DNA ligase [Candidatus Pacearchaeota archaeon]|jgi:DNA ligase-1
MKYSELCEVYEAVNATTKRLEKTSIISYFLKKLSISDKEVIYLLLGTIYPAYGNKQIGISNQTVIKAISKATGENEGKIIQEWRKIGDLGQVAEKLTGNKKQAHLFHENLTTEKIIHELKLLVDFEGKGTVGKKIDLIAGLLSEAKPVEAKYLVRILLNDLRIGLQESTIRDAIGEAFFPDIKQEASKKIQSAYDLYPDMVLMFESAKKGLKEIEKINLHVGTPVKAMLAQKVSSITEGFEVVGKPAAFEYKYDGFRLIINKSDGKITLFTRRLENVSKQFPDVVEYVDKFVGGSSFIIDCEIVGYEPRTKKYLPFQSISQRIKRKYDIEKMVKDFPVEVNVFDILFYNGENLINKPFIERTKLLRKLVKNIPYRIIAAKQLITDDEKKAKEFFDEALKSNQEGLMIKNLQGIYKPGSRVGYMVKLKPEHRDLDLVIVGAEFGTGKRAGWLSSFILACKNNGEFLEVGRVGTGIKEKSEEGVSFQELTKLLKPLEISAEGRDVRVKPKIVVAIIYQEIQKSPTYSSGYALRFPRVVALRPDKSVSEIATLKDIEKEYEGQK